MTPTIRDRTPLLALLALCGACAVGVVQLARPGPASAGPGDGVIYVAGDDSELVLWRQDGDEIAVSVYTLGSADPEVDTGWRPVREDGEVDGDEDPALVGPFLFSTSPSGAATPALAGRIVTASGAAWDPDASRFVSVGPNAMTLWRVHEGRLVEAVRHTRETIPPGFETLERKGPSGRLERRTTMGPPPRTHTTSQRFPLAPKGRLLGRRLGQ